MDKKVHLVLSFTIQEAIFMNWSAFLDLVRCPNIRKGHEVCRGMVERDGDEIVCRRCGHKYTSPSQENIPALIIRSEEEEQSDRYEDPKNRHAEHYAGLWAYGYYTLKRGDAEGLYRTMNELAMAVLPGHDQPYTMLEIGCGVGRTACDLARYYPHALVVGIDGSRRMLRQAYRIAVGDPVGKEIAVALDYEGLGTVTVPSFNIRNIIFTQADALNLPFMSAGFDLVVGANVFDRVGDPERMVAECARVLKTGASLVLATPLNWSRKPFWWSKYHSLPQLESLLHDHGFAIDLSFDGLIYREVLDLRGAFADWPTAVVRAIKKE